MLSELRIYFQFLDRAYGICSAMPSGLNTTEVLLMPSDPSSTASHRSPLFVTNCQMQRKMLDNIC